MADRVPVIVYAVRSGGLVKIGRTMNLVQRMSALQTGASAPLELVATGVGEPGLELELHRKFKTKRRHGEWFELDEDDVVALVERLNVPNVMRETTNRRPIGHVREIQPGRWRLYVELDRDPLTGRRRQRTKVVAAETRREALAAQVDFAKLAHQEAERAEAPGTDATVDELLDRWLDNHAVEASTKADWSDELRRYVRPHIGGRAIAGVDAHTIDALYRKLERAGGKGGRPLAGATVRHVHTCLRLAFAQAVRWRWIAVNPVLDARPPAARATEVDPPDVAARAALLAAAAEMGPSWPVALRLAVVTGARRGELCGLQWGDLDLDAGTVTFRRVVRREGSTYVVAPRMKTAASRRTIALGAPTVTALRVWRRQMAERALAAGVGLDDTAFVLSADPAGRTFRNPAAVSAKFARIRKLAGQPGVRLHDLRHAFATELLAAGVDVRTVAGRGGWANASVLLRTYAHFVPARDQAAAEILDGLIEQSGG